MIKVFNRKNGMIKFYIDEFPFEKSYEELWIHKSFICNKNYSLRDYIIGIEAMRHTGGRMLYGLLCARVHSNNENGFNVSIAYTKKNSEVFETAIISNKTYVYKGLKEEYLDGVFEGVNNALQTLTAVPGVDIDFEIAANDEAGSCHAYYSNLASLLIKIISEESINSLINMKYEEFAKRYIRRDFIL